MEKKKVLLIVTGSIAAYKALELLSLLKKNNCFTSVLITNSALEFVTPLSFLSLGATIIKNDLFDIEQESKMGHIRLSRENDIIIIYPATAHFVAQISSGKADSLASAIILASNKKIFIAPAMNVEMWHNKITQENISKLEDNNINIIYPETGKLACGEEGEGKICNPKAVMKIIQNNFSYHKKLHNKNIIITAGATIEKIDPVRFISNFSSGKQGVAIAQKCKEYGANVTLVIGNVTCRIPNNLDQIIKIQSAKEMEMTVIEEISKKPYDYLFMVAAICDYSPQQIMKDKIKKDSKKDLNLTLTQNPDITKLICNHKSRPKTVISFAAETEDIIFNAEKKLKSKTSDYIVANNVKNTEVFGSDRNNVTLIGKRGVIGDYSGSKEDIAVFLIKECILKKN